MRSPLLRICTAVFACAMGAAAARAQPQLRVSEVFAASGSPSAPDASFVELYNAGDTPAMLDQLSLQVSVLGSSEGWMVVPLSGSLPAKRFYLIMVGAKQPVGTPLPAPDQTAILPAPLGSNSCIALVSGTSPIAGRPECPFPASLLDLVGAGALSVQRWPCGTPGETLSNAPALGGSGGTLSVSRRCGARFDSGSNADQFELAPPSPRNLASGPDAQPPIAVTIDTPLQSVEQGASALYFVSITTSACAGPIVSATADGSTLGSSAPFSLTPFLGNQWVLSVPIPATTLPGDYSLALSVRTANIGYPERTLVPLRVLPANDTPCKALPLAPNTIVVSDNTFATDTGDGPACATLVGTHHGLWYSFVAPSTGAYDIITCGSAIDTDLELFIVSNCPGTPSLAPLGLCDDLSCAGGEPGPGPNPGNAFAAALRGVRLIAGQTVHARLSAYAGQSPGRFQIAVNTGACCRGSTRVCISTAPSDCALPSDTYLGDGFVCSPCPCAAAPANDLCAGAVILPTDATPALGDNRNATGNGSEGPPSPCQVGSNFGKSVWFRFTPPSSGLWQFSTCGTPQDTVLQIFTGTCAAPALLSNGCNDDGCNAGSPGSEYASLIPAAALSAGSTYLIRVSSWNPDGVLTPPAGGPYTLIAAALGTCCRGSTCSPGITMSDCAASPPALAGWSFVAATGGACNTAGNVRSPCCYADFNKSGSATVDDIFMYLNAWFARSPFATVGGDGVALPTIDDIFRFLNAWFTGCS